MIALPLVFSLALGACAAPADVAPLERAMTARDTTATLYAGGVSYAQFLEEATNRKAQWTKHSAEAAVPDALLARARAVPGKWKLLVVLEDGCSDSVNTIPYMAKLVELVPTIEMRLVRSAPGKPIMEAHRTPDGRAATPTVVLLDESLAEKGCWVERPVKLRDYLAENREKPEFNFGRDKQAWYDADKGAETVTELVEMLEGAAAGTPRCK